MTRETKGSIRAALLALVALVVLAAPARAVDTFNIVDQAYYPTTPGASGQCWTSNGALVFPSWQTCSAGGGGTVTVSGTPTNGQCAQWTTATNIIGVTCATLVGTPANGDQSIWTSASGQGLLTAASGSAGAYQRGGGTGVVPVWSTLLLPNSASAGQIMVAATSNSITMSATPTLGASGTLGSVTLGNATSGTITLQPVTGALGTPTVSIPALTKTLTATILSGAKAMGTGALAANTCASVVTDTATGTLTTDVIIYTPNADASGFVGYGKAATDGLKIYPYPTADTVNFVVCNATGTSITVPALTLNWRVVR